MKSNSNIINSRILRIIALVTDRKITEIKPELKLTADLDLQDYHYVDILILLEDEFNIPFKLKEIINIETVQELLNYIVQEID